VNISRQVKWEGGQVPPFLNPPPQLCSIHLGVARVQDTGEVEQYPSTAQCPLWVKSGHRFIRSPRRHGEGLRQSTPIAK